MQQQLGVLMHRTSSQLAAARLANSHATRNSHSLVKLAHPDMGLEPATFPATLGVLRKYKIAECNALLSFYNLPAQGTLQERRSVIGRHIGCLEVE